MRDDLFEHDAECVRLSRAALPAPEGVTVEAVGKQARRPAGERERGADLEQRTGRAVQQFDGGRVRLGKLTVVERTARTGVEEVADEFAEDATVQRGRRRLGAGFDEAELSGRHRRR